MHRHHDESTFAMPLVLPSTKRCELGLSKTGRKSPSKNLSLSDSRASVNLYLIGRCLAQGKFAVPTRYEIGFSEKLVDVI